MLTICLLNLIKIFHYIKQYSIVHSKIHVTLCSIHFLNNKSYNTCFLTICFYRPSLISKVKGKLNNVIENSAIFIKSNLHLPIFVKALTIWWSFFCTNAVRLKNLSHDFFVQTLQRRHAWPILQNDNKGGLTKSQKLTDQKSRKICKK